MSKKIFTCLIVAAIMIFGLVVAKIDFSENKDEAHQNYSQEQQVMQVQEEKEEAKAKTEKAEEAKFGTKLLCGVALPIGVMFTLIGTVKFALAHAIEEGPEMQKGAMLFAIGIILIAISCMIQSCWL